MTVNRASLKLIKDFEGWRAKAYPDPATGGDPWTIGYGHTSRAGLPTVMPGLVITQAQGEEILQRDLGKYAAAVTRLVKVDLNANQFGALVSFCYNVGPGNFARSSVLKRVNSRKFDEVPARLLLWNKADGKVMRGLTRRRRAEGVLFMTLPGHSEAPRAQPDDPGTEAPKPQQNALAAILSAIIAFFTQWRSR